MRAEIPGVTTALHSSMAAFPRRGAVHSVARIAGNRNPALHLRRKASFRPPCCVHSATDDFKRQHIRGRISASSPHGRRATPMGGPAQRIAEAEPSVFVIPILQQTGVVDDEG